MTRIIAETQLDRSTAKTRLPDRAGDDLILSPIGFGAFKIGRNQGAKYPQGYALPDDYEVERLLNGILDLGITHIDTAPAYGSSEERIGRFLAHRRHQFVLSTKVGETFENGRSTYDFSRDGVRASIERSLNRLQTDVLDMVFVHAPADDLAVLRETAVVETLSALKQRGSIRAIGLSAKSIAGARVALDWADVLMVEYHPLDASFEPVIAEAAGRGVRIVVKKALASGSIPPKTGLPFVLAHPGVTNVVVGGLSLEHLRENVQIALRSRA